MNNLKVGDIVARKSYGSDILFKVAEIKNNGKERIVILKGICYRIEADAPETDLIVQNDNKVNEYNRSVNREVDKKSKRVAEVKPKSELKKGFFRSTSKDKAGKFFRPGNVLHIDGDNDYLDTCLEHYKKLGIDAVGKYVPEKNQPFEVYKLLQQYKPDILVLTGHDGMIKGTDDYAKLDNYRNSSYYVESIKEARRFNMDLDGLVIFAGACQSKYDSLIKAGANFASSPYRVLIHALDPVFICQKIAYTGIDKVITPQDIINLTITGVEGIGGIQTRGKYREGFPEEPYKQ